MRRSIHIFSRWGDLQQWQRGSNSSAYRIDHELEDENEAIRLKPTLALAFYFRSMVYGGLGDGIRPLPMRRLRLVSIFHARDS